MVVGVSGLKIRQEYSLAQSEKPAPRCDQLRIPVHVLVIQVTCHQNGKTTTKVGRQIQIDERLAER